MTQLSRCLSLLVGGLGDPITGVGPLAVEPTLIYVMARPGEFMTFSLGDVKRTERYGFLAMFMAALCVIIDKLSSSGLLRATISLSSSLCTFTSVMIEPFNDCLLINSLPYGSGTILSGDMRSKDINDMTLLGDCVVS